MAKKTKEKATETNNSRIVLKGKEGFIATFVHLLEPDSFNDKYSVRIVIPKSNKKAVKVVKDAIADAMQRGSEDKFKGKSVKKARNPLKDGDDEETDKYPFLADSYLIDMKSNTKPTVIDKSRKPLTTDDEVYSGMMVFVAGFAMPYFNEGSWGVNIVLDAVVKVGDGERIGGSQFDLNDAFGDVLDEDEWEDDEDEDIEDEDADDDEDDEEDDDEDDEDDDEDEELDLTEANKLLKKVKKADKKAAKKFEKKLSKIDDEDDLDDLIDDLEEWIEENA